MNVTKDVIIDLFPLYLERECSADTRALVDEYLQRNPGHAEELRRVLSAPPPCGLPSAKAPDETEALRAARRVVRRRSWMMALAIFCSLTPLSCLHTGGRTYWLFLESPKVALLYAGLGVAFWILYAVDRRRSYTL